MEGTGGSDRRAVVGIGYLKLRSGEDPGVDEGQEGSRAGA